MDTPRGKMVAFVGPSGAGKDTLMMATQAARPDLHLVRRVITRPSTAGGEDFDGVTPDEFARRVADGQFALHWQAHGLSYGIPAEWRTRLAGGESALINLSRAVLVPAAEVFESLVVVNVTAPPEVLAQRLAARGRESAEDIARRLSRVADPLPATLNVITVQNTGTVDQAVSQVLGALFPSNG